MKTTMYPTKNYNIDKEHQDILRKTTLVMYTLSGILLCLQDKSLWKFSEIENPLYHENKTVPKYK